MSEAICYAGGISRYHYNVTFIVKSSGEILTKSFDSPYLARQFVNKLKHSKRCSLISHSPLN